jgi:hypothetical protein
LETIEEGDLMINQYKIEYKESGKSRKRIFQMVNFETGKWMDKFSKKDAEYIKRNIIPNAWSKSVKLKKVI